MLATSGAMVGAVTAGVRAAGFADFVAAAGLTAAFALRVAAGVTLVRAAVAPAVALRPVAAPRFAGVAAVVRLPAATFGAGFGVAACDARAERGAVREALVAGAGLRGAALVVVLAIRRFPRPAML